MSEVKERVSRQRGQERVGVRKETREVRRRWSVEGER